MGHHVMYLFIFHFLAGSLLSTATNSYMTVYSLESSRGRRRANMSHTVDTELEDLDKAQLEELYAWLDQIPLSWTTGNIARDFSDGVLVAEVVKHFLPKMVYTHNYPPATSTRQKMSNWYLLNSLSSVQLEKMYHAAIASDKDLTPYVCGSPGKVFKKMHFQLSDGVIRKVSISTPGVVQKVLSVLKTKLTVALARCQTEKGKQASVHDCSSRLGSDKPEVDQNIATLPQTRLPKAKPSPGVSSNAGPYKGSKVKSLMDTAFVPLIMLEEKEQEYLAKDETIQILQNKVKRLKQLIHLKDTRINDLQAWIEARRLDREEVKEASADI